MNYNRPPDVCLDESNGYWHRGGSSTTTQQSARLPVDGAAVAAAVAGSNNIVYKSHHLAGGGNYCSRNSRGPSPPYTPYSARRRFQRTMRQQPIYGGGGGYPSNYPPPPMVEEREPRHPWRGPTDMYRSERRDSGVRGCMYCMQPRPSSTMPTASNQTDNPSQYYETKWWKAIKGPWSPVSNKLENWTTKFVDTIGPTHKTELLRRKIFSYFRRLVLTTLATLRPKDETGDQIYFTVLRYGSLPLLTYLPDGDIDAVLATFNHRGVLLPAGGRLMEKFSTNEMMSHPKFPISKTVLIEAEVRVLKICIRGVSVDLSVNKVGGSCSFAMLDLFDRLLVRNEHIFKRSVLLIKAWCSYESRTLGSKNGLMATYALEVLVMCLLSTLGLDEPLTPLMILRHFLAFYANFEWDNFAVTACGPIPLLYIREDFEQPPRAADFICPFCSLSLPSDKRPPQRKVGVPVEGSIDLQTCIPDTSAAPPQLVAPLPSKVALDSNSERLQCLSTRRSHLSTRTSPQLQYHHPQCCFLQEHSNSYGEREFERQAARLLEEHSRQNCRPLSQTHRDFTLAVADLLEDCRRLFGGCYAATGIQSTQRLPYSLPDSHVLQWQQFPQQQLQREFSSHEEHIGQSPCVDALVSFQHSRSDRPFSATCKATVISNVNQNSGIPESDADFSTWGSVMKSSNREKSPREESCYCGAMLVDPAEYRRENSMENGGSWECGAAPFQFRNMNILDPLQSSNNLGRSVSTANFYRIGDSFKRGSSILESVISGNDEVSLECFFKHSLRLIRPPDYRVAAVALPSVWVRSVPCGLPTVPDKRGGPDVGPAASLGFEQRAGKLATLIQRVKQGSPDFGYVYPTAHPSLERGMALMMAAVLAELRKRCQVALISRRRDKQHQLTAAKLKGGTSVVRSDRIAPAACRTRPVIERRASSRRCVSMPVSLERKLLRRLARKQFRAIMTTITGTTAITTATTRSTPSTTLLPMLNVPTSEDLAQGASLQAMPEQSPDSSFVVSVKPVPMPQQCNDSITRRKIEPSSRASVISKCTTDEITSESLAKTKKRSNSFFSSDETEVLALMTLCKSLHHGAPQGVAMNNTSGGFTNQVAGREHRQDNGAKAHWSPRGRESSTAKLGSARTVPPLEEFPFLTATIGPRVPETSSLPEPSAGCTAEHILVQQRQLLSEDSSTTSSFSTCLPFARPDYLGDAGKYKLSFSPLLGGDLQRLRRFLNTRCSRQRRASLPKIRRPAYEQSDAQLKHERHELLRKGTHFGSRTTEHEDNATRSRPQPLSLERRQWQGGIKKASEFCRNQPIGYQELKQHVPHCQTGSSIGDSNCGGRRISDASSVNWDSRRQSQSFRSTTASGTDSTSSHVNGSWRIFQPYAGQPPPQFPSAMVRNRLLDENGGYPSGVQNMDNPYNCSKPGLSQLSCERRSVTADGFLVPCDNLPPPPPRLEVEVEGVPIAVPAHTLMQSCRAPSRDEMSIGVRNGLLSSRRGGNQSYCFASGGGGKLDLRHSVAPQPQSATLAVTGGSASSGPPPQRCIPPPRGSPPLPPMNGASFIDAAACNLRGGILGSDGANEAFERNSADMKMQQRSCAGPAPPHRPPHRPKRTNAIAPLESLSSMANPPRCATVPQCPIAAATPPYKTPDLSARAPPVSITVVIPTHVPIAPPVVRRKSSITNQPLIIPPKPADQQPAAHHGPSLKSAPDGIGNKNFNWELSQLPAVITTGESDPFLSFKPPGLQTDQGFPSSIAYMDRSHSPNDRHLSIAEQGSGSASGRCNEMAQGYGSDWRSSDSVNFTASCKPQVHNRRLLQQQSHETTSVDQTKNISSMTGQRHEEDLPMMPLITNPEVVPTKSVSSQTTTGSTSSMQTAAEAESLAINSGIPADREDIYRERIASGHWGSQPDNWQNHKHIAALNKGRQSLSVDLLQLTELDARPTEEEGWRISSDGSHQRNRRPQQPGISTANQKRRRRGNYPETTKILPQPALSNCSPMPQSVANTPDSGEPLKIMSQSDTRVTHHISPNDPLGEHISAVAQFTITDGVSEDSPSCEKTTAAASQENFASSCSGNKKHGSSPIGSRQSSIGGISNFLSQESIELDASPIASRARASRKNGRQICSSITSSTAYNGKVDPAAGHKDISELVSLHERDTDSDKCIRGCETVTTAPKTMGEVQLLSYQNYFCIDPENTMVSDKDDSIGLSEGNVPTDDDEDTNSQDNVFVMRRTPATTNLFSLKLNVHDMGRSGCRAKTFTTTGRSYPIINRFIVSRTLPCNSTDSQSFFQSVHNSTSANFRSCSPQNDIAPARGATLHVIAASRVAAALSARSSRLQGVNSGIKSGLCSS